MSETETETETQRKTDKKADRIFGFESQHASPCCQRLRHHPPRCHTCLPALESSADTPLFLSALKSWRLLGLCPKMMRPAIQAAQLCPFPLRTSRCGRKWRASTFKVCHFCCFPTLLRRKTFWQLANAVTEKFSQV